MNSPAPHDFEPSPEERWTEQRLERLLGWFFAQEMPPALRESKPEFQPVLMDSLRPRLAAAVRRPVPESARWLVPLCVSALIGCGWLLWQTPQRESVAVAQPMRSPIIELETASLPVRVEQVSYQGASGSFEQRTELRWTSNSYFEPSSGAWVEWSAPELVIDVKPIATSDSRALPRGL